MRHAGLWRAFDLSAWGSFLDFALVPVAAALLLVRDGINIGLIVAGFAAWTFAEYWIHRLVFHGATPFGYCAIHVRMHHGNRKKFGRYVAFMFDHHAAHHRGGHGNFGVSTNVWDIVFRTYQPQRKIS